MSDLSILGLAPANPVIVGSGLLTDQERNIRKLIEKGAGAVVTKTIHPRPPQGLDERILRLPVGMLNSTTYSKRSVNHWLGVLRSFADDGLPVIASLHADTPAELAALAKDVEATGCRALELGISCLNEEDGLEDDNPDRVYAYTSQTRGRTNLPFSVKLAVGEGLQDRVRAAIAGGADAITLSDTIPGAAVSPETGELELNGVFGYSGPGLKPLVLAAIWQLRKRGVELPILGGGGVTGGRDVADYLNVGATVAQVYTALHTDMYETLERIVAETGELVGPFAARESRGAVA
ncbi:MULTISPECIES: dihydroorotate dehydrogenase [Streptomyces]|uniref:dihydrouracil dehydrogenase (NAD(+)) n=1 Tax=Streptomyces doudnae TaxID=3075536 RepID=A0ABD5EM38_9ACTN|nr:MULTISPECIES: dihydroorotate dehydrogenase [unclassified Streptomyces]MDT0434467.1 dihydroorotate dehydrogenase [Streptomyces sp. DSM 41981]MYQ69015.1 dihydroorotate dehydrogenase [Streptomyces sp. SID4950]SCE50739.1 dihydroorotate oxidase B, catalytic subunit [Streptomyces sp. SolWspMP-5a-2]